MFITIIIQFNYTSILIQQHRFLIQENFIKYEMAESPIIKEIHWKVHNFINSCNHTFIYLLLYLQSYKWEPKTQPRETITLIINK